MRAMIVLLAAGIGTTGMAETLVSPFTQPETEWHLAEMDGAPFEGNSTILFPENGRVAGRALCNRFMGTAQWSPEALSFGPLATSMMACPELDKEHEILGRLSTVVSGGIDGDRLVMSLPDGSQLIYVLGAARP